MLFVASVFVRIAENWSKRNRLRFKSVGIVDIQELFEASVNEPDEIKKNLYDSLYTYVLQKRQEDIISRPGFVI